MLPSRKLLAGSLPGAARLRPVLRSAPQTQSPPAIPQQRPRDLLWRERRKSGLSFLRPHHRDTETQSETTIRAVTTVDASKMQFSRPISTKNGFFSVLSVPLWFHGTF